MTVKHWNTGASAERYRENERASEQKKLSAFKDGVADGLLEGYKSEWHENLHYYKQGYDFGLTMYSELDGKDWESENEHG